MLNLSIPVLTVGQNREPLSGLMAIIRDYCGPREGGRLAVSDPPPGVDREALGSLCTTRVAWWGAPPAGASDTSGGLYRFVCALARTFWSVSPLWSIPSRMPSVALPCSATPPPWSVGSAHNASSRGFPVHTLGCFDKKDMLNIGLVSGGVVQSNSYSQSITSMTSTKAGSQATPSYKKTSLTGRRLSASHQRGGIATPLLRSYIASCCFAHGRRRSSSLRGCLASASTLVCLFPKRSRLSHTRPF